MQTISKSALVASSRSEAETELLSDSELTMLEELEQKIGAVLLSFIDLGEALEEILENRLYREEFNTFEDYCRKRWGFSRQRAYQLIEAAKMAEFLSTKVDIWPSNESQVRPLVGLAYDKASKVWKLAESLAGKKDISGRIVKEAITALSKDDSATTVEDTPETVVVASISTDATVCCGGGEFEESETSPDREVEIPIPEVVREEVEKIISKNGMASSHHESSADTNPEEDSAKEKDNPASESPPSTKVKSNRVEADYIHPPWFEGQDGKQFLLADGSECYSTRFTSEDSFIPATEIHKKITSMAKNNEWVKANSAVGHVFNDSIASRQKLLIELVDTINRFSSQFTGQSLSETVFRTVDELQRFTTYLKPVSTAEKNLGSVGSCVAEKD